jgi:hypothetical protein
MMLGVYIKRCEGEFNFSSYQFNVTRETGFDSRRGRRLVSFPLRAD